MRNNDHIFTKTLKIREIQYRRSTMLQCLFPEMNGNLAQLAFQAGNEIPAFNGEAELTFFLQSSTENKERCCTNAVTAL